MVQSATFAVLLPAAALAFEATRRILAGSDQDVAWTEPGVLRVVVLTAWYLIGWPCSGWCSAG